MFISNKIAIGVVMKMQKPKSLKKGDTIGLITPSSAIKDHKQIDIAKDVIRSWGFNVKEGLSIRSQYGYLAGTDEERINDINGMFKDPQVNGIFCLRGGYGTLRIADKLDIEAIKQNPKIFVGYSDVTTFLVMMQQLANLVVFHGPMPAIDFSEESDEFTVNSFLNTLTNNGVQTGEINNPYGYDLVSYCNGIAEGILTGGNLTLISLSLGTPWEIDLNNKILFIEDINIKPYHLDGLLCHLKNSGKLEGCRGFLIGDFANFEEEKDGLSMKEIIYDILKPLGKPILGNIQSGHCIPKITLPFGVNIRMDSISKRIMLLENCCE